MKIIRTYETEGGKELQLFVCPTTAHLKFQFGSGGELPEQLGGHFTSERVADVTARSYLLTAQQKKQSKKVNEKLELTKED
jgi:hypothetical protein